MDLIQKGGRALANRCFLCHEREETIDHLLFHCTKARVLWELFFSLVGVSWVLPSSIKETLLSWHGLVVGKKHMKVSSATPLHIFLDGLEGEK